MRAPAGAGTAAMLGCVHKAAHCPWEQQESQRARPGMLLQGTSTGE